MRILMLAFVVLLPALAAAQQADKSFGAWGVFTTERDGKKVCYITSSPVKKAGTYRKRSEPYMLVTLRDGVVEVSVSAGYAYRDKSTADADIDGAAFVFFATPDTPEIAWLKDDAEDARAVDGLKKGSKLIVKAVSKAGTRSTDTYSLSGFGKAYDRMQELCSK